jgi:hypothetical protein
VKGILLDNNIEGHLKHLLPVWLSPYWREEWASLALTVHDFEQLGLARNVPDSVLWQICQDLEIVLVTANRNDKGPDSLEATIRNRNGPTSLPVVTLADGNRILKEPTYAYRVAEKILDYLFDIDKMRGTGRLFVP